MQEPVAQRIFGAPRIPYRSDLDPEFLRESSRFSRIRPKMQPSSHESALTPRPVNGLRCGALQYFDDECATQNRGPTSAANAPPGGNSRRTNGSYDWAISPIESSMRKASGFTLIEIAVVLVIAAFVIAMFATVGSSLLAQQKRSITMNRLAAIDAALVQYVMQQKRLPCPANGTLTTSDAGAGSEVACSVLPSQANGVVPWTALGLAEQDIVDGWGRRFTYRVDNTLVSAGKMDMSWCDPAGTAGMVGNVCSSACAGTAVTCTPPTTYLSTKGLTVKNTAGTSLTSTGTPNTAAAYVLISHGETGGGGYLSTGQLAASTGTDGTEEQKNYASAQLSAGYYYVDSDMVGIDGASHFDDVVLRPTIMSVVTRAGLGPRAH